MARRRGEGDPDPLSRHVSNPRVQKALTEIIELGVAEHLIVILESMEKTNMKLLQNAENLDELITCREFAKCVGMLCKKIKRASQKKKESDSKREREINKVMREEAYDG